MTVVKLGVRTLHSSSACASYIYLSGSYANDVIAVRSSMASERLEDLILISSEKTVLDTLNISVIVDKFAAVPRALPL